MSLEDKLYPLLSAYERLPAPVKYGIGFAYRQLPASFRWGAEYPRFRNLVERGEHWTSEQATQYQWKQLRKTLIQANSYCPYYQRRFAEAGFKPEKMQSPDDLQRCPFLEKGDLLQHRNEMVSTVTPESSRLYITTGGSTGVPVGFYLQKGISRPKEQAFLEGQWKRAGYFDGARLAVVRGHVTSSKAKGRITSYDATRDWLMLSSYHLTAENMPLYLEEIEKFKPDLLHAYPSAALQIAEYLEQSGQEWRLPLRGLLCGSERLTMPQKKLVERVFKCRAYMWYGHSERVVLAGAGRTTDLLYFWPQYGFVEFGEPDAEGLREVIGTSFDNMVMPLIRYRTGDYVQLAADDDKKEFPWPAAVQVAGREQEFLVSGSGRKISMTAFNMHDSIFDDLYAVQFVQNEPGRAEFRYMPGPLFDHARLPHIEAGICRKLGDDFVVSLRKVEEVERTSRGKHKWLVSTLK
ncbi:MAG: phenylacetate--CoA ligase family protein [Verrucomicrobiales bacterium]